MRRTAIERMLDFHSSNSRLIRDEPQEDETQNLIPNPLRRPFFLLKKSRRNRHASRENSPFPASRSRCSYVPTDQPGPNQRDNSVLIPVECAFGCLHAHHWTAVRYLLQLRKPSQFSGGSHNFLLLNRSHYV